MTKVCVYGCVLSCVQLFVNPQTVAHQAPLSIGFPRQGYWSGLPFPSLGNLPKPGIQPILLCLLHWQMGFLTLAPPGRPQFRQLPIRKLQDHFRDVYHWIIKKAREFQQNIYFCFIDYAKAFVWITTNCGKFLKRWEY